MTDDPDPIAAWRAVLLAQSRAVRAIEAEMESAGAIPLSWYDVLLELQAAPNGQLRMQDLALRAVLSRTRISRVVTELELAGLVERLADPGDGRAALATITAEGRQAFRQAAPVYQRSIAAQFTQYLSPPQQRAIARGLQRVIDAQTATIDPRR